MPSRAERRIRIGAAGFFFVELVRSALGIGGVGSAEANQAKFQGYLRPENRQVQTLTAAERADLQNPDFAMETGAVENAPNSERLGQLAGYVQNIDLGDGRVTSNYYDLDGELVSRTQLDRLMQENLFQVIPLSETVVLGGLVLAPPDDGEWRLIPKQQPRAAAELPETAVSPETVREAIVAYVNDQDLGRGDGSVSALFYSPDGQLMSQAEVDALLEQGDFVVRPVVSGEEFTSGEPLPVGQTWYSVRLQPRRNNPSAHTQDVELGTASMDSTDGIALAMHVVSEPGPTPPPDDGDGEDGENGGDGTGDDASQVPSGEQEGQYQEGGNNKPLEVAFVDSYLQEHAASPAEAQWMALSAEDQRALAVYFQMSGVTNLEGGTIQPGDLSGDVAQSVTINGVRVFRAQLIPSGAFDFYLPQEDGTMLHVSTEAEFIEAVTVEDAPPAETAVNWLNAPAGERPTVETAPALLEVMNNPEAEIPPVQVTPWSVMDFSEMPDEYVEYYSNYPIDEAVGTDVPELDNTSFRWTVVPDARADQFLNVAFPEFIQNLPAEGVVRYVTPEGVIVSTTTEAMRNFAPQVIGRIVSSPNVEGVPSEAWVHGETFSTVVVFDDSTNVATVFLSSPDVFDPYTRSISKLYYRIVLSVFTQNADVLVEDEFFKGPIVPKTNNPDKGLQVITSPLELELYDEYLHDQFDFQPVETISS